MRAGWCMFDNNNLFVTYHQMFSCQNEYSLVFICPTSRIRNYYLIYCPQKMWRLLDTRKSPLNWSISVLKNLYWVIGGLFWDAIYNVWVYHTHFQPLMKWFSSPFQRFTEETICRSELIWLWKYFPLDLDLFIYKYKSHYTVRAIPYRTFFYKLPLSLFSCGFEKCSFWPSPREHVSYILVWHKTHRNFLYVAL